MKKNKIIAFLFFSLLPLVGMAQDKLYDLNQTVDEFLEQYAEERKGHDTYIWADGKRSFEVWISDIDVIDLKLFQTNEEEKDKFMTEYIRGNETLDVLQCMACTFNYTLRSDKSPEDINVEGQWQGKSLFAEENWQVTTSMGKFLETYFTEHFLTTKSKNRPPIIKSAKIDFSLQKKQMIVNIGLDFEQYPEIEDDFLREIKNLKEKDNSIYLTKNSLSQLFLMHNKFAFKFRISYAKTGEKITDYEMHFQLVF